MAVKHGKLEGQLPNLKPYTDVLGMMRTTLYLCQMFGILLYVCNMCGILLYVCRMLHVLRHAVRCSSGYMNNAY